MTRRSTLPVLAGRKSSGEAVYEDVLVDCFDESRFLVVATPGLVLGIARGDVVTWIGADHEPEVVSRGGFLALQVHGPHDVADTITEEILNLGGLLDGRAPGLTVYSVPVKVGFARVEEIVDGLRSRHPEIEWYYANVYAKDGVTPLNWW